MIIDGMKKCSKCGEWKPTEEFYKNTASNDGLQRRCISCDQKHDKERFSERRKQYRLTHPIKHIDTTHRVCKRCKIYKPIEEFWRDRSNKTYGRMSICIECKKELDEINEYPRIVKRKVKYLNRLGFLTCLTCGTEKPLSEFYKDKSRKGGYRLQCKTCKSISDKKYREKNKHDVFIRQHNYYMLHSEKIKNWNRDYRLKNIEIYKENDRKYAESHKAEKSAYNKAYRALSREELIAYGREYRKTHEKEMKAWRVQYYIDNKEAIKLYKKQYYATPKGKHADMLHSHRRRFASSFLQNTLTLKQWEKILEMQQYICLDCKREFSKNLPPTRDHIIPLSTRKRLNPWCPGLTFGNTQALCRSCNSKKHNRMDFMRGVYTLLEYNMEI
jgi:hypothetical protein